GTAPKPRQKEPRHGRRGPPASERTGTAETEEEVLPQLCCCVGPGLGVFSQNQEETAVAHRGARTVFCLQQRGRRPRPTPPPAGGCCAVSRSYCLLPPP
ncbi:unnamed protein product, partial [Ectocarpus fasciculatus]